MFPILPYWRYLQYNRPVISPELARELKVAQLPWRPRRGDVVVDRLNIPYLVLKDGTDEDGAVEIDTPQGVDRRPFLGLTWLPHLEQLLAVLARHGAFQLEAAASGEGRRDVRWSVEISGAESGQPTTFSGSDPAETAGKALHHLLGEAGWRPGRAV